MNHENGHQISKNPSNHWDIPPELDTLLVFRSFDVEHEVLPTYSNRMAFTIWYYGHETKDCNDICMNNAKSTVTPPHLPNSIKPDNNGQESIFVAIPSYRDTECEHTLRDLYEKASNPSRIFVGLCLQNEDEMSTEFLLQYPNVRVAKLHYTIAKGPCYARSLAQELWKGEDFYLQIDSHMRYVYCVDAAKENKFTVL